VRPRLGKGASIHRKHLGEVLTRLTDPVVVFTEQLDEVVDDGFGHLRGCTFEDIAETRLAP
jgi:hypothetical protein